MLDASGRSSVQRSLLSFTRYFFPNVHKVYSNDNANDASLLARAICEVLPSNIEHQEGRSWLVAEGRECATWEPSNAESGDLGTLYVTGTVRGGRMSADRLVHIPGYGDFQVEKVSSIVGLSDNRSFVAHFNFETKLSLLASCCRPSLSRLMILRRTTSPICLPMSKHGQRRKKSIRRPLPKAAVVKLKSLV